MTSQTAETLEFDNSPVPIIDISPYFTGDPAKKAEVARQIDHACRNIGFLVISGHGVADEIVARTYDTTRTFFDLPLDTKFKYEMTAKDIYRGFSRMESSALAYTIGERDMLPDHREMYVINRHDIDWNDPYFACEQGRRIFPPNVYPEELPEMKPVLESYYDTMTGLATTLMRLFALALNLEEDFFDDKVDKHMTNFVLSDYPDQPEELPPGQMRAGAHTDYGSLTILRTEDKPGGLEVRTRDGRWAPVPIVPGTFIINIGDLMAQWTNDQWISTMHRVVNPPRDKAGSSRRISLIFFHQPNYDARIECLPSCVGNGAHYSPTTSGEHLLAKMIQANDVG